MPKVTVWIRNEDWKAWQSIDNKPEWLHQAVNLLRPKAQPIPDMPEDFIGWTDEDGNVLS